DAEHAFLEDANGNAESSCHRQGEATRSNQRYPDGAEHEQQDDECEHQDNRDVRHENVIEALRDVIEDWGDASDAVGTAGVVGKFCLVGTQRFKSLRGLFIGSTRAWGDHDLRGIHVVSRSDYLGVYDADGSREIGEDFLDGWHALLFSYVGEVNERNHGGVAAWAECFIDHVIGLRLGSTFSRHAIGWHREAHLCGWNSCNAKDEYAGNQGNHWVLANLAYPLQTNSRFFIFWVWHLRPWDTASEDLGAQQAE